MLEFLRGKASDRKLRLFACACNYQLGYVRQSGNRIKVVEVAERLADGIASPDEVREVYPATAPPPSPPGRTCVIWEETVEFFGVLIDTNAERAAALWGWCGSEDVPPGQRTHFLHDIFGPLPFRPVTLVPTATVTHLAEAIYTDRAFDRLPILADALEDAGCTDADILAHCRGGGEHVRGCWVVDLLLGKE